MGELVQVKRETPATPSATSEGAGQAASGVEGSDFDSQMEALAPSPEGRAVGIQAYDRKNHGVAVKALEPIAGLQPPTAPDKEGAWLPGWRAGKEKLAAFKSALVTDRESARAQAADPSVEVQYHEAIAATEALVQRAASIDSGVAGGLDAAQRVALELGGLRAIEAGAEDERAMELLVEASAKLDTMKAQRASLSAFTKSARALPGVVSGDRIAPTSKNMVDHSKHLHGWLGTKKVKNLLTSRGKKALRKRKELSEHVVADASIRKAAPMDVDIDLENADFTKIWSFMKASNLIKGFPLERKDLTPEFKRAFEAGLAAAVSAKPKEDGARRQAVSPHVETMMSLYAQLNPKAKDKTLEKLKKKLTDRLVAMAAAQNSVSSDEAGKAGERLEEALGKGNWLAKKVYEAAEKWPNGAADYAARVEATYDRFGIKQGPYDWYANGGLVSVPFLGQKTVKVNKPVAPMLTKASSQYLDTVAKTGVDNPLEVSGETAAFNFRGHRETAKASFLCKEAGKAFYSHHAVGEAIDVNYGKRGAKQNMHVKEVAVWKVVAAALQHAGSDLTFKELSGKKDMPTIKKMIEWSPKFPAALTAWEQHFADQELLGDHSASEVAPGEKDRARLPSAATYEKTLDGEGLGKEDRRQVRKSRLVAERSAKKRRGKAGKAFESHRSTLAKGYNTAKRALKSKYIYPEDEASYGDHLQHVRGLLDGAGNALDGLSSTLKKYGKLEVGSDAVHIAFVESVMALEQLRKAAKASLESVKAPSKAALKKRKKPHRKTKTAHKALSIAASALDTEDVMTGVTSLHTADAKADGDLEAVRNDPALAAADKAESQVELLTLYHKHYRQYLSDFRLSGFVDLPYLFVDIMRDNGWRWGGAWSTSDFMHFDTGQK